MAKQHLTADGWRTCVDTTGRCPYDTHRAGDAPQSPEDDLEARMMLLDQPETQQRVEYRPTATFPSQHLEAAEEAIAKANRKLEKYDIPERFTYSVEHEIRAVNGVNVDYAKLTLNKPVLRAEGWQFIAAHEFTPNGDSTSRFLTEEALTATKPVDQRCEHCGRPRHRERVYWVKSETTGEIKQVGSSCLKGFLGVAPKGLWALGEEIDFEERYANTDARASQVFPTRDLVAAAFAAVNEDGGFVSRKNATREQLATADKVMGAWSEYAEAGQDAVLQAQAQDMLAWAETIPADHELAYMRDLRTTLTQPWVKAKHVPVAVSGISAMANEYRRQERERERAAERATIKQAYFAPKGAKVAEIRAKVTSTYNYLTDYGSATQYVFQSDDGYVFMWRTSANYDFRKGDEAIIQSGTVKDNSEYNGVKQTVLTRAKLRPVEQPEPNSDAA